MKRILYFIVLLSSITGNILIGQEIKPLFDYWQYYSDHTNVLYKTLAGKALAQLDQRKRIIAGLETGENWLERQAEIRKKLKVITGKFPEKTPLNPRITGRLEGDGFYIEKIIYESQPGFHVTAALFIPDDLQGKAPAVLYCSGHTFESFRSRVYQHMIINLVKKGCVVLAFDPIGQGERQQYLGEEGKNSIFRTPTHEHSYPGGQCFIAGSSLAMHMIWDGIRSIDYLLTRPEVDPERIGITGRSGGGTQSAYIAAFDPRIRATAPECYITGYEYIFKSIGPQDAEQNFPRFLEYGLDLADLLEVRAPKPAIIISTTRDFFSIQGARDTYREVKEAYERLGHPGNIEMAEDDAEHETTLKNREALYAFFKKHLAFPGNVSDEETILFDPADLQVTISGQVIPELKGETIFSLNRKFSGDILAELSQKRKKNRLTGEDLKNRIKTATGYVPAESYGEPVFSGREIKEGYILEKYLLPGSADYFLPVLVLNPENQQPGQAVVMLNPEGKEKELTADSLGIWFVKNGYLVILPDIAGFGELGPGYLTGDAYMEHTSYNQWFAGILTGKSPVGLRMADIHRVAAFARSRYSMEAGQIHAVAREMLSSDLLHLCAVTDDFSRILLIDPLVSFRALVMNSRYHPKYIQSAVPESIRFYDLPDLAVISAPIKLMMIDVNDQNAGIIPDPDKHEDILLVKKSFEKMNRKGNFVVEKSAGKSWEELAGQWVK